MEEDSIKRYKSKTKFEGGKKTEKLEPVAIEDSFDLIINGSPFVSLMASPINLKEMGFGYLLSEGIVKSKDQIKSIEVEGSEIRASIEGHEKINEVLELRSSGCMGVKQNHGEKISVNSDLSVNMDLIVKGLQNLDSDIHKMTRGTHISSLLDNSGDIAFKVEDISRHNTFDKVIGKAILEDVNLSKSILISSGRQSEGMVMKAGRVGIPIIASKSAPLSSGIKAAKKNGQTLIWQVEPGDLRVFSESWRIRRNSNNI